MKNLIPALALSLLAVNPVPRDNIPPSFNSITSISSGTERQIGDCLTHIQLGRPLQNSQGKLIDVHYDEGNNQLHLPDSVIIQGNSLNGSNIDIAIKNLNDLVMACALRDISDNHDTLKPVEAPPASDINNDLG